MMENEYASIA